MPTPVAIAGSIMAGLAILAWAIKSMRDMRRMAAENRRILREIEEQLANYLR